MTELLAGVLGTRMTSSLALGDSLTPSGTLDSLLTHRTSTGDRERYIFPESGAADSLTDSSLYQEALALGAKIRRETTRGDRVIIALAPGRSFVVSLYACILSGAIAVPCYPPRRLEEATKVAGIIADASPAAIITTDDWHRVTVGLPATDISQVKVINPMTGAEPDTEPWDPPKLSSSAPVILQYTSGSTRQPRGVILTHQSIVSNCLMIAQRFAVRNSDIAVLWLPPYHDMGLIGGIIAPVLLDFQAVLMSPSSFLTQPYRWLRAISDHKATISGGPDFAYALAARKVSLDQIHTLDLDSWEIAFNGSEPIRPRTIRTFTETFAPCGFREQAFLPCYGLAEATLLVAGSARGRGPQILTADRNAFHDNEIATRNDGDGVHLVSCGPPADGVRIRIVHKANHASASPGEVGEIWVESPAVGAGYWRRPEETQKVFRANLADGVAGEFLDTGDFGFLYEGELYVAGRRDDTLIIRGRNFYPQDIEETARAAAAPASTGAAAAFLDPLASDPKIVVLLEIDVEDECDRAALTSDIRAAISREHGIPIGHIGLLQKGSVPRTTSGKVQRRAARSMYETSGAGLRC